MHNLCHLENDVRRFSSLQTISAYPFETNLYQIKNMIRTGNKPLIQIAKRFGELNNVKNKRSSLIDVKHSYVLKMKIE